MKIYVYCQNVNGGRGEVCDDPDMIERYEQDETGDIRLFHEGEEEEIISCAMERLTTRNDTRAGGMLDRYDWQCCQHVLDYLGGPKPKYDEDTAAYTFPVMDVSRILECAGHAFSGNDTEHCKEIAEEWLEEFEGDTRAIEAWVTAGYWSPSTARIVSDIGYTPRHTPSFKEPRSDGSSPVYALCNGDVNVSQLEWA